MSRSPAIRSSANRLCLIASPSAPALLVDVLIAASTDSALANTSVPALPTASAAEAWLHDAGWDMWVVTVDGVPAGYVALHAPDLSHDADRFSNHREVDCYLLPQFRGQRWMARAIAALTRALPPGTNLVAEIWVDNQASLRLAEREGWSYEGTVFWQNEKDPDDKGWCRRYAFTVPDEAVWAQSA